MFLLKGAHSNSIAQKVKTCSESWTYPWVKVRVRIDVHEHCSKVLYWAQVYRKHCCCHQQHWYAGAHTAGVVLASTIVGVEVLQMPIFMLAVTLEQ